MPIVGIGGGELGTGETLCIDRRIVELTGKSSPRALLLPTASKDNQEYYKRFSTIYGECLGCQTDVLNLTLTCAETEYVRRKILSSDLVYVGGGNTTRLMRHLREMHISRTLAQAYREGVVLCGVSAGSICWFDKGRSASPTCRNLVTGLGFIKAINLVHFEHQGIDEASIERMLRRYPGVVIALEDLCAIEIVGRSYRILSAHRGAKAYKIHQRRGKPGILTRPLSHGTVEELLDRNETQDDSFKRLLGKRHEGDQ